MLKYYIVYKLDRSMNFFLTTDTEGQMLDHIMGFKDGPVSDIGNYDIYQQII